MPPPKLATPEEVSAYLGVPKKTLYQWKYLRSGPRCTVVGRHLRYRWSDVEAWLEAQPQGGDAETSLSA